MSACKFELEVLRAVRDDRWSDDLRMHVASCEECAAALAVEPWMEQFAAVDEREHLLPDPQVVWLKAQLLRNTIAAERITRPMNIVQLVAYAAVAACWAGLLNWKWDALQQWLHNLSPSNAILGAVGSEATATLSLSFFVVLVMLSSITAMVALHTVLAEE